MLFIGFAVLSTLPNLSYGQDPLGGLLGGQGGGAAKGGQPTNPAGGVRGVIRGQVQNAIQSNLLPGSNVPGNNPVQGNTQIIGQPGQIPNQIGWTLSSRNNSVYISSLVNNSIATQAGLRTGDQIVSVNGNAIGRPEDVNSYYSQANNSPVTILYLRNGQTAEVVLNSSSVYGNPRANSQSILSKLDQIERLILEIRAELANPR